MPTAAVALVVAIVVVLAMLAIAWFKGAVWPLGVLAVTMVVAFLTYLFNHAQAALVFGFTALGGIVLAVLCIIWTLGQMMREETIEP